MISYLLHKKCPGVRSRLLVFPAEANRYRFHRACRGAFAAAYAFCRVRLCDGVDIHRAYTAALSARYTAFAIYMHTIQAYFIKKSVDGSKRAHDLAEKAAAYDATYDSHDQYYRLEAEQPAKLLPELGMRQEHRYAALKSSSRAYVFAECRYAKAKIISDKGRYHYHKDHEQHVLYVSQRFIYAFLR